MTFQSAGFLLFPQVLATGRAISGFVLFDGCLTSQQHASVSQGRICSDNLTCCHTEIQVADQTFQLTQSQYTDTGPTSPSTDPITPSAWQGSLLECNFEVTGMIRPPKNPGASGFEPGIFAFEVDALTTRPTRRCISGTGRLGREICATAEETLIG